MFTVPDPVVIAASPQPETMNSDVFAQAHTPLRANAPMTTIGRIVFTSRLCGRSPAEKKAIGTITDENRGAAQVRIHTLLRPALSLRPRQPAAGRSSGEQDDRNSELTWVGMVDAD